MSFSCVVYGSGNQHPVLLTWLHCIPCPPFSAHWLATMHEAFPICIHTVLHMCGRLHTLPLRLILALLLLLSTAAAEMPLLPLLCRCSAVSWCGCQRGAPHPSPAWSFRGAHSAFQRKVGNRSASLYCPGYFMSMCCGVYCLGEVE